jgi:uncharacterized membrane protein YccC
VSITVLQQLRHKRRDLLRVGLQTGLATALIYGLMQWQAPENMSWAIIAGLFTIGLSADATYYSARGRIIGAMLGIALGLTAAWGIPGPALIGLMLAVMAANMVATLWPSLRYAAVTAAIVALAPTPAAENAAQKGTAIVVGTLIAAGTSFIAWPTFGRRRVIQELHCALVDCRDLLKIIAEDVTAETREARDTVHVRFLRHLETCHSQIATTRFHPALPGGAKLRDATTAVEKLWHAIGVLDRAVFDEQRAMGMSIMTNLHQPISKVVRSCEAELAWIVAKLCGHTPPANSRDLRSAIAAARTAVRNLAPTDAKESQMRGLHAVLFAIDEIGCRMEELEDIVASVPEAGEPQNRPDAKAVA